MSAGATEKSLQPNISAKIITKSSGISSTLDGSEDLLIREKDIDDVTMKTAPLKIDRDEELDPFSDVEDRLTHSVFHMRWPGDEATSYRIHTQTL